MKKILLVLVFACALLFAERGIMGVYTTSAAKNVKGVVISKVLAATPAAKAGLKPNDIIYKINNDFTYTRDALDKAIDKHKAGDTVTINFKRGKKSKKVKLILAKFDENLHAKIILRNYIGVEVYNLTSQLKKFFKVKNGVLVAAIDKNSPAAKANLKAGDIITKVNKDKVNFASEFYNKVSRLHKNEKVTLSVKRLNKNIKIKSDIEVIEQPYIDNYYFWTSGNKIKDFNNLNKWADSLNTLKQNKVLNDLNQRIHNLEKKIKTLKTNK